MTAQEQEAVQACLNNVLKNMQFKKLGWSSRGMNQREQEAYKAGILDCQSAAFRAMERAQNQARMSQAEYEEVQDSLSGALEHRGTLTSQEWTAYQSAVLACKSAVSRGFNPNHPWNQKKEEMK